LRVNDLVIVRDSDRYQCPDLYYTDGGIPFHQKGLNILAHLYNESQRWHDGQLEAVAAIKLDWTPNVALLNYEYGFPATVQHYPWQTDKSMGACWYWLRDATSRYKSADWAIGTLLDAVSRNGNLLLNIPLTPEGELEPETAAMLTEMGECLDVIGEAVFGTRPWVVADDGPGSRIRFTRNKQNTVLYVSMLGWPGEELKIRALGSSRIGLENLQGITMLGAAGKLPYEQRADGLRIKLPPKPFDSLAYALKLTFNGPIPMLKPR
jgi:alpha-L-fucosidase